MISVTSFLYLYCLLSVKFPEFFWADRCIHQIHDSTTIIVVKRVNVLNLCLQMLLKCTPLTLSTRILFVKPFPNHFSLHHETFFVDDIWKIHIFKWKKCMVIFPSWKNVTSSTEGITRSSVNYLRYLLKENRLIKNSRRKSEHFRVLLLI